jgi:integrase
LAWIGLGQCEQPRGGAARGIAIANVAAAEIDPYTDEEREPILKWFSRECREYYAFVYFRFWTGTRPSEAIALRWSDGA